MTYHSVIHNFANIGLPQAQKLREQLSLAMPVELLKFCGTYYKSKLKRDPFVDELKMLDQLISLRENEGSSLALTEFFTNDAFVARTYADLLKKRKQLHPDLSRPCTLEEAANVASEYIRYAKSPKESSNLSLSLENVRDVITYPDKSCVTAQNSPYRLRLLPLAHATVEAGDVLILTTPAGDDTQSEFRRKSAALLRKKELMQYVKGVLTVGRGGILHELLKMTDGAAIQLSALSPVGTSVPATTLCDGFLGSHILRVAPHQWNIVATLFAKGGVRALPFASIQKEPKFTFIRDKKASFALDAHFLRSLNRYKAISAKLADESELSNGSISFGGIGGGACSYLASEIAEQIGEVIQVGTTACTVSSAKSACSPYKTALWSVLAPVAALSVCGVPYSDQVLSIALELPQDLKDPANVGNCMSSILGLYRAQTELGLATASRVSIRTEEQITNPSVSVWSMTESPRKMPNTFAKSGSFVYAVSPVLDKDGLPDFAALRQLLNQITAFVKEGKILSCRTLVMEAITDGVRKMSNTHTCVFTNAAAVAGGKQPLCILIESEEVLPFCRIGKVHPFRRLPKAEIEIPERTDLIACEKPDVVIISSLTDNNAMALAAFLEERGAHVSLFTNSHEDAAALSRALLTAQTCILCSNVKLPKTKQMDFAMETLRRAGGILLSLSKTGAPEGFVSLKNGIDEEILKKICL